MMQSLNARALGARAAAVPQGRRSNACRAVTTATARVDRCNKNSVIVSPSILSANFAKLGEQARKRGCCAVRHSGVTPDVHTPGWPLTVVPPPRAPPGLRSRPWTRLVQSGSTWT